MGNLFRDIKNKLKWRSERKRMMKQYRQDYVPPYTMSEELPEEVMNEIAKSQLPKTDESEKLEADVDTKC